MSAREKEAGSDGGKGGRGGREVERPFGFRVSGCASDDAGSKKLQTIPSRIPPP